MKRLAAISTLLASLTIPVLAQHGGGHAGGGGGASSHGGGFSGGFRSAPSGPAPRAGFSGAHKPSARPGYEAGYRGRPGAAIPRSFSGPGMQTTTVSPYRQAYRSPNQPENGPENRRWNRGGFVYENHRDPRSYSYRHGDHSVYIGPYYWPYPSGIGFYGLGSYGGDADGDGYYDDSMNYDADQVYGQGGYQGPNYGPNQYSGFDPQANYPDPAVGYQIQGQDRAEYQDQEQAQVQGPEPGQYPNQIPPGAPYQPFYGPQDPQSAPRGPSRPQPAARPTYRSVQTLPNQAVPNQPAVTLVFKDNRPNQVIHNYLINGSTLTVWDQSAHDIPVEDLNIEATRKLNRNNGIDFLLPSARN